ncbi:MAG: DUF262 domain-containing HNH endonuclease family protein [Chloroflexi bacterium]|nr:DUF262 domain-containing HNH endonuclease family protein [Chloroflexota bacterium]
MTQTIKANERDLKTVFSDDYLLRIPVYQRPYAWTTEQVDELLDDLFNAVAHDEDSPYFLGSVVLIKSEAAPDSEVVDGQQRLTTLAMLLCVLRELASSPTDEEIDAFIREKGNSLKGTQDRFRLRLRDRDAEFFAEHVQTRGGISKLLKTDSTKLTDSQNRIRDNLSLVWDALRLRTSDEREALTKFAVQQCFLVVVTATDRDSAYRIFSVMNDRGLDLSPTDILKADTIGGLQPQEQESYGAKWEAIEDDLGRDAFRDLFAHIRMIYVKTKLRRTLQADFQEHVLNETPPTEFIDDVLGPFARDYGTVRDASYESTEGAEAVNRHLRYLGRLDNFDWIPPAMAYFKRYGEEQARLLGFTKDLERLAYGFFVRRTNVNERIQRYAEVLNFIEDGGDVTVSESPLQLRDEEKQEVRQQLDGPVYTWVPVARRVLLQRLDSLVSEPDAGAEYTHTTVTVEHVLPQGPPADSEWLEWFPDEGERNAWTHRLANLVLLSRRKNSQASNWGFERKKREYFQRNGVSVFPLTTQVLSEPTWTPQVLERRQRTLLAAFTKEWRLG